MVYGYEGDLPSPLSSNFDGAESAASPTRSSDDVAPGTVRATSSATGTNVQEAGVDEPDLVKTDGSLLVRVQEQTLTTYDVTGREPERLESLVLPDIADPEVLLAGDRAVVIGADTVVRDPDGSEPDGPESSPPEPSWSTPAEPGATRVIVVDVADPAHPSIVATEVYDTALVTARQHGDTVRLVLSAGLPDLPFVHPGRWRDEESALERNRDIVRASRVDDWLPTVTTYDADGRGDTDRLLACDQLAMPADETGLGTLAVVGFDPAEPGARSVAGVTTDSGLAYFSTDRLYLATAASDLMPVCCWEGPLRPQAGDGATHVYEFDLDGTSASYAASGEVDGRVADRWAMDEHDGVLRVAVGPTQLTGSFNSIVTLERDGDRLVEVGRVDRLGVGEEIRSMRWFDGLALMVTFRQVDPLYAVDLSDPARPRRLGTLKIPGYSEYLHPLGSHRLLGLGQGPTGRGWGAQAGLFDVTDLTRPRRIDVVGYAPGTLAEAGRDPRQFTWLPDSRTVLTVVSGSRQGRTGMVSVLTLRDGRMSNRMVEVEYGAEVDAGPAGAAARRSGAAGDRRQGHRLPRRRVISGACAGTSAPSTTSSRRRPATRSRPRHCSTSARSAGRRSRPRPTRRPSTVPCTRSRTSPGTCSRSWSRPPRRRTVRSRPRRPGPGPRRGSREPAGPPSERAPMSPMSPMSMVSTAAAASVDEALGLLAARPLVVLTGAGLSTDSGIPDYRGPGSPTRMPMTYQEFVSGPAARQRYWARSHLGWGRMKARGPQPGAPRAHPAATPSC